MKKILRLLVLLFSCLSGSAAIFAAETSPPVRRDEDADEGGDSNAIDDLMKSLNRNTAAEPLSEDLPSNGELSADVISDEALSGDVVSKDSVIDLMRALFQSDAEPFDATPYGLEGNYVILQEEIGNLSESGGIDRVRLLALRKMDGIYDRTLLFEVTPAEGEPFLVHLPEEIKSYESKMQLCGFTSRNKSEILLFAQTTIEKDADRLLIVEVKDGKGNVLYDSASAGLPTMRGKFFDDYRTEIYVEETGNRILIDLFSRKSFYDRRRVYNANSGRLRSPITVWRKRFSRLEAVDTDNDGIFELKGVIDLHGAGKLDLIAYLDFTLKYVDGKWLVLDSWISPAEDLRSLPLPKVISHRASHGKTRIP